MNNEINKERKRKLFVSYLNPSTTNESLCQYFSKYGKISNAYIIRKPGVDESRGFGYVKFEAELALQKALAVKNHQLDGANIQIKGFVGKNDQKKIKYE